MNKAFSKALMVILAVIMILSSVPLSPIAKNLSDSPIAIVAQAAAKKTRLNTTKKSIYVGKKYTLKLLDKNGKTISASKVKWSTADKSIATVSKGVVSGKKTGKVKITATYQGKKYTATITVNSTVTLSKTKLTFKIGETAKKTIKVTRKDNNDIKWKVVSGKDIVKISQAKKWKNNSKNLYITPTGKKYGEVKIKVYSAKNSNNYTYLYVDVKAPYTLKVKNKLPCTINNYSSQYAYETGTKNTSLKITKVSYKVPDKKTLNITLTFEARNSIKLEDYFYIKYRILDKNGFLVESDNVKSKLMMVGDKAKAEISLKNLKNGAYTIDFKDFIATPNTGTSTTPSGSTATTPSGNTATPGVTQPSGATQPATPGETQAQQQAPVGSKIDKEALAMFQKAAKDINTKGVAGYSYKSWQAIESINVGGNDAIKGLIEGFFTKEADAETKVQQKGSEDAMRRMPLSNCTESTVESVTKTKSGSNYIITIVMKDVTNPAKTDTDGLNVMSRDFLYMEDVHNTVTNDATVSKLVKSLNKGEITYKAYTITAEMTKDGKFVEITHRCAAELVADATLALNIPLSGNGVILFNTRYWDFKY